MELTISYLVKVAITLFLLYLLYYALLSTQVNFRFNKFYLLMAPIVAFLFPLMEWSATLPPETAVGEVLQSIQLREIVITTTPFNTVQPSSPFFSFTNILFGIYGIGIVILFIQLLKQLWQVQQLKKQAISERELGRGLHIYQLADYPATFAFGNSIFLGKQSHLSAADQDKILAHELAHVHLHHSWDILYYELLTALLWFNPIIWLLKQELRNVHEYQADAKVLQKYPSTEYSNLLSREALQHIGLPIGSYFQKPQVLKRLQMLQSNGQTSSWLRPLLILPALGALLFMFSLQAGAQITETVLQPASTQSLIQLPEQLTQAQAKKQKAIMAEPATADLNETTFITAQPAPTEKNQKVETAAKPTFTEVPESMEPVSAVEEKPYTYVEQMPKFEGGDVALLNFLGSNIEYPEAARRDGKEGIVTIGFTVDIAGRLANYELLKGISEETDAEAMRVIKLTDGKWSPGRQNGRAVPVRYIVPIRFKIE